MSSLSVAVAPHVDRTRLVVTGDLDGEGAQVLMRAVTAAATSHPGHIEIDLSRLQSFTSDGVLAVTGCRRLQGRLSEGVSFRVRGGPGAGALLASFAGAP